MSHNVSFPAEHLSAYDIGKRIQIISPEGAKITDELTRIIAFRNDKGVAKLFLHFANVLHPTALTHLRTEYGFEVNPEQMVKRVEK
jgi:hypothetical protein